MIGSHFASLHESHGVDLRTGVGVRSVSRVAAGDGGATPGGADPGRLVIELSGGETFHADVVVVGIGVVPTTDWLVDSGLTIDNGVVCDERLFAAVGIVAAGDIARWQWRRDGGEELIRIEHWQVAAEAGVAAGRALMAGPADAPVFAPVPYFWSDQYGIRLQVLGSPRGSDDIHIAEGSPEEGKFLALFGRADRLRAVMAIGKPRQLMGYRPLLVEGSGWRDALAHGAG
jgi:3-phenylpropionate/trans-cinnamate dioxygenase ferredoxin reductase subunit